MNETFLWHKKRTTVECNVCINRCSLKKGETGLCGSRRSNGERIILDTFGKLAGLEVGKVEDKNVYHFMPDADTLFVAVKSNWKLPFDEVKKSKKTLQPKELVEFAEKKNVRIIFFAGTEPTPNLEYVYRVARLARRVSIKTLISTVGIMTEEAFKKISKYVDGILIHFVATGSETAKKYFNFLNPKQTYKITRLAYKQHLHLEIADTVIPQLGDDEAKVKRFAQWIVSELDGEIPFHLLSFRPSGKLKLLQKVSLKELKRLAQVAKGAGLRYVYVGNLKEKTELRNTYCYNCRNLLIERKRDGRVKNKYLQGNYCPYCGVKIKVVIK